jgi:hypothetical protein
VIIKYSYTLKCRATLCDNTENVGFGFKMVLSLFECVDRCSRLLTYCLDRGREPTSESQMRGSLDL